MSYRKIVLLAALCVALPQLALADSIDPVVAAYKKLQTAHFRTEMTVTDEKGKVTKGSSEYEGMDHVHSNMGGHEMVMLPGGTWMRINDKWTKSPMDMSAMVKKFAPMGEEMLQSAKNVRDEGPATFQGQPAHVYSFDTDTTMMGIHATGHNKVYLNGAGLMIGMEHDGEAMGHKSSSVQAITYDDSVHVQAPAG